MKPINVIVYGVAGFLVFAGIAVILGSIKRNELLVFLATGQWPSEWLQRLGERDADMTIARRDIFDNELFAVFERHVERS